jgi:hypothetical protein
MAAEDAKTPFRHPKQQAPFVSALFRRNGTRNETPGSTSKSSRFTRNSTRNSSPFCFGLFRVSLFLERPNRNRAETEIPERMPEQAAFSSKSTSFVGNGEKQDG